MASGRKWTQQEEEYLQESWGYVSFDSLCKSLNRTRTAIKNRVQKLGLPPFLEAGDYITLHQLCKAFGYGFSSNYVLLSWVKNRGLKIHKRRRGSSVTRVIYVDEFWQWAEKHRNFLDFSKMQPYALGEEPPWVSEQRKKDFYSFALQRKDPWTKDEDQRLINYLKQHKYSYVELSEKLRRSAGAIQRRCTDLGIKERPIKADNHGAESQWTDEHFKILAQGIRNGDSYMSLAKAVNRSEKAVRSKVYFVYLTENLDKVRAMLGQGDWGTGAPVPTVKQGRHLSRTRTEVKDNLTRLVTVLRYRMNELGYDPYWQRFMCLKWDDIKGCTANCTDCDSCTEFKRIQPQYCVRCGATFFERVENKYCASCRTARKKQAQRKWRTLNSKARR